MTTIATPRCLSSTWLPVPIDMQSAIRAGTHRVVPATKRLEARWATNAREAVAIRQLRSLTDRELQDMGINRGDIARVAREANSER